MISVVIPISGNRHLANLGLVGSVLKQQTLKTHELILVEQRKDKEKNIYENFPADKYVSVVNPYNDLFHRNWLMNVGANMSTMEKILFMDADIFFGCDYLEKVYSYKKPWFVAWSKLYYLTKEITDDRIARGKPVQPEDNYTGESMVSEPLCAAGGSVCVDREWFYSVFGGLNENYFGWGAEDNDSACRAMNIMKEFGQLKYTIYHLHHGDDRLDNIGKCSSAENNYQLRATQQNPSEVTKRILNSKIGQPSGPTVIKVQDLIR